MNNLVSPQVVPACGCTDQLEKSHTVISWLIDKHLMQG